MKIPQSEAELKIHLQDQLALMARSCSYFDKGEKAEIKRIAQALRILLHDTRHSKSLLGQLGKKQLLFVDTAMTQHPMNLLGTTGLCGLVMGPPPPRYVASACTPFEMVHWMIPFESWWHDTVISVPSESYLISRSALVLTRADQDGGAHVDPRLEEWYYRTSRENVGGMMAVDGSDLGSYVDASIRQIAFELEHSISYGWTSVPEDLTGDDRVREDHEYSGFNNGPTYHTIVRVPRNLCPCRSGLTYQMCHRKGAVNAGAATEPTQILSSDPFRSTALSMLSLPGLIEMPKPPGASAGT
jgi:hypothetical protein